MDTILVIEDNEEILENLTEYLELEGYKILGANNGKRGIELAREFIPDLILCDVLMHAMKRPRGFASDPGFRHNICDTIYF